MIIYCIQNEITGKVYVGQTSRTIARRWYLHCRSAGPDYNGATARVPIACAIRKYGAKCFRIWPLAETNDPITLDRLEQLWIILLRSTEKTHGYNLAPGGGWSTLLQKLNCVMCGREIITRSPTGAKYCKSCKLEKHRLDTETRRRKRGMLPQRTVRREIPNLRSLYARHVAGESIQSVAQSVQFSRPTITNAFLRAGLQPRSQSAANKLLGLRRRMITLQK